MPNFIKGVADTLNLQPATNIIVSGLMQKLAEEKQKEEKRKQDEINLALLSRIQSGGRNDLSPVNTIQDKTYTPDFNQPMTFANMLQGNDKPNYSNMTNQIPFEETQKLQPKFIPEDRVSLATQLTQNPGGSEVLKNYFDIQDRYSPKAKYTDFLKENKNIAFNTTSNRYEDITTGNPVDPNQYKTPEEPKYFDNKEFGYRVNPSTQQLIEDKSLPNPKYKPLPKIEFKDKKEYDKNLRKWKLYTETYEDGRLTKRSTPSYQEAVEVKDGLPYISKSTQQIFDDFEGKRRELKARKDMVYQMGNKEKNDKGQWEATLTSRSGDKLNLLSTANLGSEIANNESEYIANIKRSAPVKFNKWYDRMHKDYGKKDPETMNEFVQEALNAFRSGEFKTKIKVKNLKTGEVKIKEDPGTLAMGYVREMTRALYGEYPQIGSVKDPQNLETNDYEIVEEQ